jgi:hypothetical protein
MIDTHIGVPDKLYFAINPFVPDLFKSITELFQETLKHVLQGENMTWHIGVIISY